MKALIPTLLILLISCSKRIENKMPEQTFCDFGIEHFNFIKRSPVEDYGKKPIRPPKPNPQTATAGVILLDFNGCLVSNTSWNYMGDLQCSPSNLSLMAQEEIEDSIASKYSIWKVVVTTDEAIYNASTANKRVRLVFTETWEWYYAVGGASFINSFSDGSGNPCFVFTSLLNYNTKFIYEAGAHEIGHTFGLYHQSVYDSIPSYPGSKIDEYNYGNNGSAPIMGVAYYQPLSKWTVGYNSNKILQDDIAKISLIIPKK